jgi:hypothetical protein
MGNRWLETTMRYRAPAMDVHDRLDKVQIDCSEIDKFAWVERRHPSLVCND